MPLPPFQQFFTLKGLIFPAGKEFSEMRAPPTLLFHLPNPDKTFYPGTLSGLVAAERVEPIVIAGLKTIGESSGACFTQSREEKKKDSKESFP